MDKKIKIGIVGYGNIGKGVLDAVKKASDMELKYVFTRRNNLEIEEMKTVHISKVEDYKEKIDVMILCGGSAKDLPVQGPIILENFNTVDSFDNHANIPKHFKKMDEVGKKNKTLGIISVGWDPGLFSINRFLGDVILPESKEYTFWGKGVSQGHSEAIRRITGVRNAVQYTIPKEEALNRIRNGENINFKTREKHSRVCYIVLEENGDKSKIQKEIREMPNYFLDYDTEVNFISEKEFERDHLKMPHGGFVIISGETGDRNKEKIEFSVQLDSNPEFTSGVLVAYARAVYKMSKENRCGAITVFDVPLKYLSQNNNEELREKFL